MGDALSDFYFLTPNKSVNHSLLSKKGAVLLMMASIDDLFKVKTVSSPSRALSGLINGQKPYAPSNKRKFEISQDPSK